ncbi:YjdF family protein [Stomatobaculum longum]|uniref:YjdF family protein n=1 Tax=Stomatobaculum longum TaxID=796942 RepID=UPI0028D471F5|nr:YjdF family protein [Stomatobaculum longum]
MDKAVIKLTVYFADPFWVGVIERIAGGHLSAAKITFGAEPKDYEIAGFIQRHFYELRFSQSVPTERREAKKNSKTAQRDAKRQMQEVGIGTKSQQALKLQHEAKRLEGRKKNREEKQAKAERLFLLKQQKRKEKHRGR